ncbi:glycoside hydrolase family 17 protein [Durotheca rogersii]|uniref:glycoside hydrolase family 17 protein n=1 Tax=Durotheca rogersii TaxID=419775 RepID=UPI00221E76FD|nr:glycoside hydrolase family 17 protein [Durotheca rogersii]KAI5866454.1 glycoside hydrolase family 17 protein [Durotheca rogersii]
MQLLPSLLLAAAAVPGALAQNIQGFNYGATNSDGSCRGYQDFRALFERARGLAGTGGGFTAARLYTAVQCGSAAAPIEAFRAAVDTDTRVLVGLWASAGRAAYENELNALLAAAAQLGPAFAERVVGISVGSEDLYRSSAQGAANGAGVGATAAEIEGYIGWLRDWLRGTPLGRVPVGHVDTWTAWVLPENAGVAAAADFLGHNGFPYFETTRPNSIDLAVDNFHSALAQTEAVARGKPVFVTETGWPSVGPQQRDAVASLENSHRYYAQVGCPLFGHRTVFWYTLVDANAAQTDLSFALTPRDSATPKFDLTC